VKPVFAAAFLIAATGPALAQQVPEEARKDLWCGLAFTIVAADAPWDATEDQKVLIQQFADGGDRLVERARQVHLAHGYTEETFRVYVETLTADVTIQVNATDKSAPFSFEACSALLGL
jgi:hypothetical protein